TAKAAPDTSGTQVAATNQSTDEAQARRPDQSLSASQNAESASERTSPPAADAMNTTGAADVKAGAHRLPADARRFTRSSQHRPAKTRQLPEAGASSAAAESFMKNDREGEMPPASSRSAEPGDLDLASQPTVMPPRRGASRSARRGEPRTRRDRRMDD